MKLTDTHLWAAVGRLFLHPQWRTHLHKMVARTWHSRGLASLGTIETEIDKPQEPEALDLLRAICTTATHHKNVITPHSVKRSPYTTHSAC